MSNANNYSTGCMAASGNPQDCSNINKRQQIGDNFKSDLPGEHDDMWESENRLVTGWNSSRLQQDPNSTSSFIWKENPETHKRQAELEVAHTSLQGYTDDNPASIDSENDV